MTVMPPSESSPQVISAGPTNEQIMDVIGLTSTSTEQFCQRLRDLFAGIDYFSLPRSFPKTLEDYQREIREINEANGWFDSERSFGDDIALLHSEVTEMYEAYRDHGFDDMTITERYRGGVRTDDGKLPKPEGVGSEAADVLVRLLDTCERHGIDLRAELDRKLAYNRTRGYRHGGKRV